MKYDSKKLDRLVCDHVFRGEGQEEFECPRCGGSHFGSSFQGDVQTVYCHDEYGRGCRWRGRATEGIGCPAYSTDPAAMMEVLGKLGCYAVDATSPELGTDVQTWVGEKSFVGCAPTLAMAACLCALRAVGVPESEIDKAKEKA